MDVLIAVLLGVVQGLTEFIPVSSSAHLVLTPYLLGIEPPSLAFDVALHMGTAAAVIVFFRAELAAMARGLLRGGDDPVARRYRRLAVLVLAASIPVGVVGLLFEEAFEEVFASPLVAALFLLVTAAILVGGERLRDARVAAARPAVEPAGAVDRERVWSGDWVGDEVTAAAPSEALDDPFPVGEDLADPAGLTLEDLGWRQALTVGVAQVFALFPGISRSGTTIVAGMASGLTREAATRFSFLLSLPALLGAGLLSLGDLGEPGPFSGVAIAAGVVAAFASGYAAIRFLIALVARDRLTGFARYAVFAALVGVVGYLMIGPVA